MHEFAISTNIKVDIFEQPLPLYVGDNIGSSQTGEYQDMRVHQPCVRTFHPNLRSYFDTQTTG